MLRPFDYAGRVSEGCIVAHPMTLPVVAMLALAGTGLGVHLGHTAVEEINPLYFTMPGGTKSYAALTPHHNPDWAHRRPLAQQAASLSFDGLGPGCVGCRTYPEEYQPRNDPAIEAYLAGGTAAADPIPEAIPSAAAGFGDAEIQERALIDAYSRYPVSEEEQRLHAAAIEASVATPPPPAPLEAEAEQEPEPVGL